MTESDYSINDLDKDSLCRLCMKVYAAVEANNVPTELAWEFHDRVVDMSISMRGELMPPLFAAIRTLQCLPQSEEVERVVKSLTKVVYRIDKLAN